MNARPLRRLACLVPRLALLASCCYVLLMATGCNKGSDGTSDGPAKVKVCYLGLTCENPIFAAYEFGYFKDEGLDVELVKSDWDSMRDGLGLASSMRPTT